MSLSRDDRRDRRRRDTADEIRQAAWKQLEAQGAASLSLRALAAELGLTAPALYRYFPSKNHLVTALVLEAFASLAAAQEAAAAASASAMWHDRLLTLGRAYRQWALERPAAWFLIFGNPVPGYVPPWEETMPVAGTSLTALIRVLTQGAAEGHLALPLQPPASDGLRRSLESWNKAIHHSDPDILHLALSVASRVQGLVLMELGRQLPPFFPDGAELYERELARLVRELERH